MHSYQYTRIPRTLKFLNGVSAMSLISQEGGKCQVTLKISFPKFIADSALGWPSEPSSRAQLFNLRSYTSCSK